jgi:hypothetical protein
LHPRASVSSACATCCCSAGESTVQPERLIGVVVYLIARGGTMHERSVW